jgi:hypothetical protein
VKAPGQGSKLAFYIYSPVFAKTSTRMHEDGTQSPYYGKKFGQNITGDTEHTWVQKIEKFVAPYDIYATVCDLLHVKINTKYTMGISVFDDRNENVGFSMKTSLIYTGGFSTYDFMTFSLNGDAEIPSAAEITAYKNKLSRIIAIMNNMRPKYRSNTIADIPETYYL